MQSTKRRRRWGMSLIEMMVSLGLVSAIGLALVMIYRSAAAEFEHSSGTMSLSQHARLLSDKLVPVITSAVGRRVSPWTGDAFYHPDPAQLGNDIYEVDFITTYNFMGTANTALERPNPMFPTLAPSPGPRNPPTYRYRVAWTKNGVTNKGRNIPARCVYMERLQRDTDSGAVADSGTPETGFAARILMRNVYLCTFRRQDKTIQLHLKVYNIDPENGQIADGELMRGQSRQRRERAFDLYSTLQLPAISMGVTN